MGRKNDLRQVDAVCREYRMTREQEFAFRDYLHEVKNSGQKGSGANGDFTYDELQRLAEEFLNA